jgi:hypothetical protein
VKPAPQSIPFAVYALPCRVDRSVGSYCAHRPRLLAVGPASLETVLRKGVRSDYAAEYRPGTVVRILPGQVGSTSVIASRPRSSW